MVNLAELRWSPIQTRAEWPDVGMALRFTIFASTKFTETFSILEAN